MDNTEYELFVSTRYLEQSIQKVKELFPYHGSPIQTMTQIPTGYFEGDVEKYRKYNTLKRIKRSL